MTERQSQDRSPLRGRPVRDAARPRGQGRGDVVAVGLTGGIGAGKSTALAMFRELGAVTVSADELVHELYARPSVSAEIGARFGPGVLDAKGTVDRGRLAASVRGRGEELRWLEELIHPLVADEIERLIKDAPTGAVVVCEVPLLFESGFDRLFDVVVTIESDRDARRRRSIHDFDIDMFAELEGLQASSEERVAGSDLSFYNDGDVEHLRGFVRGALARALRLLEEPG